jgi:TatA/E family protein of Tat protein translocase
MGNLGLPEILVIGVIAMLFFGPKRLPELGAGVGKAIRYAVEPGQMELSDKEAGTLREYLDRGGFWHCDDFWGLVELNQLQQQLKKVFPERELQDLPLGHDIFHIVIDIDRIVQVPNVSLGEEYTRSGGTARTWEQASDTQPRVMGITQR